MSVKVLAKYAKAIKIAVAHRVVLLFTINEGKICEYDARSVPLARYMAAKNATDQNQKYYKLH